MRQSSKERDMQRMARQAIPADRREAMTLSETARTEFADEFGLPGGSRNGRRHSPGGRG